MNRKFLVVIRVDADNGAAVRGNVFMDTNEQLTEQSINTLKERYCSEVTAVKGIKCRPENAVVYAVIPLEA